MPDTRPALFWFRDDLRLADNPGLTAALAEGRPLVALYVLDTAIPDIRPLGGAARWWLGRALADLAARLAARGGRLVLRRGPAREVVADLAAAAGIGAVHWNRRYDAGGIALDRGLKADLKAAGIAVHSHSAHLLHEPWEVATKAGEPFRVFTPFYRAAAAQPTRAPLPEPPRWSWAPPPASENLADWALEPAAPDWAGGLRAQWQPGEEGAAARLAGFLAEGLAAYAEARDRPDLPSTSRLSPFLRFGHLSPHQALAAARRAPQVAARDLAKFESEIYWREFSYHLLFHFPQLPERNFQPRFDAFPWREDAAFLRAWQRGRTGYPIVDAGMRQLWQTGWMHNRVRMIVASLLVKHGLIHWRAGEDWFWDTLVDADTASNAASWQWVAGSGADAAPYFRVFNPVLQGAKFDPAGDYVRRFVPELARLPADAIHAPWQAGAAVLRAAGVRLGETYPRPVVDLDAGRQRALAAYDTVKG
ncbi:cryptochrome/photolyase family protein [Ancylobacter lacus]|uniref:cryptochrome/photolyase family protein n=1 Tax=Ancylobacter lacus TaxID=2579970 RepID=UPI001BD18C85|nr:deoxyribodipyrimidine photo-lyase [Ancylobacter lacus]MBS7540313.1 deoxyribodipyrimidine photo-lyase [Ancylobacter lacus]